MLAGLNSRISRSPSLGAFTLLEVLVVFIIIGILLTIAIPSIMKVRDRQNRSAAQANVRAAIPAIDKYFDQKKTYAGATVAHLRVKNVVIKSMKPTTYCIESTVGNQTWKKSGPASDIVRGSCP
ncbi:MAG TPA: hypothetical protein VFL41_00410 [Gaiellaceae bacterium]|nr:hypothetical protein [Gaiellaceae bacterium]